MLLSHALARRHSVLPGFDLALGSVLVVLGLVVLMPLAAVFGKSVTLSWPQFVDATRTPRVLASLRLSFGASALAAALNVLAGLVVAWMLPTAVAGIALTAVWSANGALGQWLPFAVSFTPLGVWVALVFIGLPFVVRTVQPVLEDLDPALEEAAATLGAGRWQAFVRVVLPTLRPALLTGFALAFARALGEYGSVIFIAGNLPLVSEIAPLLIVARLEQHDLAGATALATVMLVVSFLLLLALHLLPGRGHTHGGGRP
jgi:sulfate/thiosulfate transport system permease protein